MHGAIKLLAVVKSLAKNNLRRYFDICIGKSFDIPKHLARTLVFHHLAAKLGICGMNRDIDRRNMHLDDAVDIRVGHISQRNVVSVKEGKAGVVVLKIQALSQPLGKLVDKAKDAFVSAGLLFIHQRSFKIKPDIIVLSLFDPCKISLAVSLYLNAHVGIGQVKPIVKHVVYFISIDRYKSVADLNARAIRSRALCDTRNNDHDLTSRLSNIF